MRRIPNKYDNKNPNIPTSLSLFLSADGAHIANAVLVDMESKVISKVMSQQEKRSWHYNPRACVSAKQGSGRCSNGALSSQSQMVGKIADERKKQYVRTSSLRVSSIYIKWYRLSLTNFLFIQFQPEKKNIYVFLICALSCRYKTDLPQNNI